MIAFSVIDAKGNVLRTGDCDRADLAKQAKPGETLVAGRKLAAGDPVPTVDRAVRTRLDDLERRIAVLEATLKQRGKG